MHSEVSWLRESCTVRYLGPGKSCTLRYVGPGKSCHVMSCQDFPLVKYVEIFLL